MAEAVSQDSVAQGYAGQFATAEQRLNADTLGMWVLLATEVMMFGGLFFAIAVDRWMHPAGAKEAARHLHMWIGAGNTAVLLTSSFAMALAHAATRLKERRTARIALAATAVLGFAFLCIKAFEYSLEIADGLVPGTTQLHEGGAVLFINLYYIATGLHAVHLTIGVIWVAALAVRRCETEIRVGLAGLYWHFVDVVWVFLYPVLYLMGRGS